MNLTFQRHYSIIVLLVSVLTFLALALGNQKIGAG